MDESRHLCRRSRQLIASSRARIEWVRAVLDERQDRAAAPNAGCADNRLPGAIQPAGAMPPVRSRQPVGAKLDEPAAVTEVERARELRDAARGECERSAAAREAAGRRRPSDLRRLFNRAGCARYESELLRARLRATLDEGRAWLEGLDRRRSGEP